MAECAQCVAATAEFSLLHIHVTMVCANCSLQVLSVRHRGGGKLPIPLSALPRSITSLAAKKVLLYHERPCTNRTLRASRGQQQQQLVLPLETPLVDCHALTSPGFGKVVSAGIISAAPSAVDLAQLAATADSTMQGVYQRSSNSSIAGQATEDGTASEAAGSISGQGYGAVLPHLDSLFIKNCLVSSHTLQQLLLGVRVAAGLQAAAGGSSAPAGATGDVCSGSCQLVRLAVTGDNAAHGEASEGWPNWPWLAVVQQLTNLQVRLCAYKVGAPHLGTAGAGRTWALLVLGSWQAFSMADLPLPNCLTT